MDVLLRRFLRAGVRRGLAGNWYWFLLAAATFFLRRVLNDRTSVVSTVSWNASSPAWRNPWLPLSDGGGM